MTWTVKHKEKYFCKAEKEYPKEYMAWKNMRYRCNNSNYRGFGNYGARGIKVSDAWNNFDKFFQDMGKAPSNCSLDRINNDKGYCKENCRWATKKQQQRNRRNNTKYHAFGKYLTMAEWAEEISIPLTTLKYRLFVSKMDIITALTKPVRKIRSSRILVNSLSFQGSKDGSIPS